MKTLTFFSFCLLSSLSSYSQSDKLSVVAGLGIPELAHLGIKYDFTSNFDMSLTAGSGLDGDPYNVVSLTNKFYLATSKRSNQNTWFVAGRFQYLNYERKYAHYRYLSFNPVIGWAFNFSNRCGMTLDIGYTLSEDIKYERDENPPQATRWEDISEPGIVNTFSLGLQFFYNLKSK